MVIESEKVGVCALEVLRWRTDRVGILEYMIWKLYSERQMLEIKISEVIQLPGRTSSRVMPEVVGKRFVTEKPGPSDWTRGSMVHPGRNYIWHEVQRWFWSPEWRWEIHCLKTIKFHLRPFLCHQIYYSFPFSPSFSRPLNTLLSLILSFFPKQILENLFCSHFKSNTSSLQKIEANKRDKRKKKRKENSLIQLLLACWYTSFQTPFIHTHHHHPPRHIHGI